MQNILFFGLSYNFWTIFYNLKKRIDFNCFVFDNKLTNYDQKKINDHNIKIIENFKSIEKNKKKFDGFIITFGGVNTNKIRVGLGEYLHNELNINQFNFIHESALISDQSKIANGLIIFEKCVIQDNVQIEPYSIINVGSIITHNTIIKKGCHIMPGAIINGNCTIKSNSTISSGAIISQNTLVEEENIIGGNSIILKNTEQKSVYYGNPAKFVKKSEMKKFSLNEFY